MIENNVELEQNQELTEGRVEKNTFILSMGEKCVESRMQEVLGVNPKTWNDLKNKGILPRIGTNGEMLTKIFKYYREQEAVSLAKVEATKEAALSKGKFKLGDTDSGLPKIVEAEKLQKIKLDRAREEEVHLKNLITRSSLLDKAELLELIAPLMGNIASILRAAADEDPSLRPTVDKCFSSLYSTSLVLCQQADLDSERYVQEMLNRDVDLDELLATSELFI